MFGGCQCDNQFFIWCQGFFFGLFYSRYWVIFPIEKFPIENYKMKNSMKNSKIFKIKGYFTVKILNDGRCHPRQLFFVLITSLQYFIYVFFSNF